MFSREELKSIVEGAKSVEEKLADPEAIKDPNQIVELTKTYREIQEKAKIAEEILKLMDDIEEAEKLKDSEDDPELANFAKEELKSYRAKLSKLEERLIRLMLPKDREEQNNAIVEIRAGTGGEEAALFAKDLFKMYTKFAERKGWKVSLTDYHDTPLGGFKEVTFLVEGKGAYGKLKFESGVHRVQRIPITESGGRIHTSTASVVVLPEADELKVEIKPEDLKIETFRAGGPGGQHVNVTDSAVRITHIPTGIVVSCQDERSQHKNRAKALRILRARLFDFYRKKKEEEESKVRRSYIGTGDRSEKIRTYNFPQSRVTDHRIGLTLYNLEEILEGNLDPIIEALKRVEEKERLKEWKKEVLKSVQ
jgi:peptide chain release factor 1